MPRKGQNLSENAKRLIREARAKQVHPSMAARGYTLESIASELEKGNQWCTGNCKAFIAASEFSLRKNNKRCRKCNADYQSKVRRGIHLKRVADDIAAGIRRRKESPEYSRLWDRTKKYGVTPEWYERQLHIQEGKCAICREVMPPRNICVDHCHGSGKVRELLCISCNTFLGKMERAPGWYALAMEYAAKHR